MKILTIVGTRPQFLKLAPLSKSFEKNKINHVVVHSGQHYDKEMSDNLFKVLNIKEPDYLLEKKGETNIQCLGDMMNKIEEICLKEKPDKLIVFGDCDTTIAGAIVARKLKIYLIHIESGMRSYNKDMPEEVNRLMTDHISDLLLCSTQDSVEKLKQENITKNVHFVGNLQLELLKNACESYNDTTILNENNLSENNFVLMTIHREYNTNEKMLNLIFLELEKLNIDIVFPIHPRTRNIVKSKNINIPKNLKLIKPVHYLDMTILERNCKFIITDSGGIQPEAWYLNKKCIIMRSETEWIEPLENNNNILYDYKTSLNEFINDFLKIQIDEVDVDCNVSENIVNYLIDYYDVYLSKLNPDRKNLFQNFYNITFKNHLPVTNKNGNSIIFHPLISSYVLRHILWEILNCPVGSQFPKIDICNIDKKQYIKTKKIFWNVYKKGIEGEYIFQYNHKDFRTGNINSPYSGLTNSKMLFIYSYYNQICNSEKYEKFCDDIYGTLMLDVKNRGCCFKLDTDKYWIDEEANSPQFILNGFLSVIRNLIDLTNVKTKYNIPDILDKNKNCLEYLLPKYDCEEYKTSKYRLTTYGEIVLEFNDTIEFNDIKELSIIYNNLSYNFEYLREWSSFASRANFFTVNKNKLYLHVIYHELFETKIVLNINKILKITGTQISNCYISQKKHKGNLVNIKLDISNTNNSNIFILKLDKMVEKYFKPSITNFTKSYQNKFYNVYHYNHIENLKYVNKYFKSNILDLYIDKWTNYTKEWKNVELYKNIKNVCLNKIK